MKERLSSFDVASVARELDEELKNARVQKTYQVDDEELRVRLYTGERRDLVVTTDRVHLTEYPKPAPQRATNFAMAVRKRTQGGFVRSVEQYDFDRVLLFEIEHKEYTVDLVVEMFGDGNIVVTRDGVTDVCLTSRSFRNRKVVPRKEYGFPPSRADPSEVSVEELAEVLEESDADLVRTLATELGLGGLYAEEVVARSGVEKHAEAADLDPARVEQVHSALRSLFEGLDEGGDPQIVYGDDGEPEDVVPIDLRKYEDRETERFDSFSDALDRYFSSMELEEVGDAEEAWKEDLEALEERLKHQERAIDDFEVKAEETQEKGDLLYAHYPQVQGVLEAVRRGKDADHDFDEIEQRLRDSGAEAADIFRGISERGEVRLELDGATVDVDYRQDVPASAEELYQAGKKAREKRKGAIKAAQDTRDEIEEVKQKGFEPEETVPQRRVRMPQRWYHEYRWLRTSNGYLVVAGRDASSNEELVKNHLEKGDLFLHTDVEGAPATVLKEGQDAPESDVKEAAAFAISNSAIWKRGMYSGDVYAVAPDQVSKTPESGEYLSKGSFAIRGERDYYRNTAVDHCVGLTLEDETRVMGGPCSAVREHCKYWVELEPGDTARSRVADEVVDRFREGCDEPDRRVVEEAVTQEEVVRALPPGESRVVSDWT